MSPRSRRRARPLCAGVGLGANASVTLSDGALTDNYTGISLLRFAEATYEEGGIFSGSEYAPVNDAAAPITGP